MKVLFISNGFPPRGQWGTEFYTHQLATGIRSRGHAVSVLYPVRDGEKPRYQLDRRSEFGIPVYELHNAGDPGKSFADSYDNPRIEKIFGELLDEVRPDVVHFTHLLWGLSVRMPSIAKEHGIATIATITDFGLLCHRGQLLDWRLRACGGPCTPKVCARCVREPARFDDEPARVLAKRLCVRALSLLGGLGKVVQASDLERRRDVVLRMLPDVDRWIVPTEVVSQKFELMGVPRERLSRLVYGINDQAFRRPERTAAGGAGGEGGVTRFGFMGQFTPHKGLDRLLEAVTLMQHRLPESVEPWEVELYGYASQGRHRRYVDSTWKDEHAARVRFMGAFEPLLAPKILERLTAVILPSQWDENAPLTVLQARAAGVPVIASDVRGVREVIEPGVHGLLFPPDHAPALADAMREIILGRFPRALAPAPMISYREHLSRVEAIYFELVPASVLRRVPA